MSNVNRQNVCYAWYGHPNMIRKHVHSDCNYDRIKPFNISKLWYLPNVFVKCRWISEMYSKSILANETIKEVRFISRWHYQIETFSALLALCREPSVTGEFPPERPKTRRFDVFYLRLNKRLSKQSIRRWFETSSPSLWRHCNVVSTCLLMTCP